MTTNPRCVLLVGHSGPCRERYRTLEICGEWMPRAKDWCGSVKGHVDNHRTRWALDNLRDGQRSGESCGLSLRIVLGPVPCSRCRWMVTWNGWEWQDTQGPRYTNRVAGHRHTCRSAVVAA